MVDSRPHGGPNRFEVEANVNTHFAWLRTRLAVERTMMAALRTGASLIGFGFSIFQFLEKFNLTPGVIKTAHPRAPEFLGLTLIGAGIMALAVAGAWYRGLDRYLWNEQYAPVAGVTGGPVRTPTLAITVLLILAGVFAFFAVLLRFP